MKAAMNRSRSCAADDGGMFTRTAEPYDEAMLARLGAQVCEFSPVDATAHVFAVAAVVTRAKRHPFNNYAKATA